MKPIHFLAVIFMTGCGSTTTFTPRSAYPPDPWVKGYSDPDDCIGGEQLAALDFDMPSYPKGAFRSGQQGWTIVRLDVSDDGATENVRIERSVPSGLFDSMSRKAVENWRFRPPTAPLQDCRVLLRYRAGAVSLGG
jgi:TonB family protein